MTNGRSGLRFRWLLLGLALLCATPAAARTERKLAYLRDEVFSCFVRLLRVDLDLKIEEKDRDGGYVLFEFRDPLYKRVSPASMELVEVTSEATGTELKVVLDIKRASAADEIALLDRLETKLKGELGKRGKR